MFLAIFQLACLAVMINMSFGQDLTTIYNYYTPEQGLLGSLKNSWNEQAEQIAQDAKNNPLKHLRLPFGLHYLGGAALAGGAIYALNRAARRERIRNFELNLQYADPEAYKTYLKIKKSTSPLQTQEERLAQMFAEGKLTPEQHARMYNASIEANRLTELQNQFSDKKMKTLQQRFLSGLDPRSHGTVLNELGGEISPTKISEYMNKVRGNKKLYRSANDIYQRVLDLRASGVIDELAAQKLLGGFKTPEGVFDFAKINKINTLAKHNMLKHPVRQWRFRFWR